MGIHGTSATEIVLSRIATAGSSARQAGLELRGRGYAPRLSRIMYTVAPIARSVGLCHHPDNVRGPAYSLYGVADDENLMSLTSLGRCPAKRDFADTARCLISGYPLMRPIEPCKILTFPPQIKEHGYFTTLGYT